MTSIAEFVRSGKVNVSLEGSDALLPHPSTPVKYLGIQLVGQFILRFDFLVRFILGLIYGE